MENTATNSPSRRGKSLKFDQEWKDAVDRLPKHYRDEICAAIEAYQRDLTVIEVTHGVPRAIFMLIMPTIRRRYRARELRRLARARKAATKAAKSTPSRRCASRQDNETQPKPTQQVPNRQPKPPKPQAAPAVTQQAAQPNPAPCEQPQITPSTSPTTTENGPGKSTLEKLLRHKHSCHNRKKHRRH
ncbi:hypothetical protein [uncultured Muribaculum sp.]|uniref:hypothetical protein n=1 Tax=uncultured Muribaculum sp. TaxID=1918613 RepID=UPI0025ADAA9F|nr:hypothetical protein [uncultured Muribaculum sp.]